MKVKNKTKGDSFQDREHEQEILQAIKFPNNNLNSNNK